MRRENRPVSIVGVGAPRVDMGLNVGNGAGLPGDEAVLRRYVDGSRFIDWRVGGMGAILTNIAGITQDPNIYLFGSVGRDKFGLYYSNALQGRFGVINVAADEPTSVKVYAVSPDGLIEDTVTRHGAGLIVPETDLGRLTRRRREMIVVDSAFFKDAEVAAQATPVIREFATGASVRVLSLDGIDKDGITRDQLIDGADSLGPNIIIGSHDEIVYLSGLQDGHLDPEHALSVVAETIFPRTQIIVMTDSGESEMISHNKRPMSVVGGFPVEDHKTHVGVREVWVGLFLGALYRKFLFVEEVEEAKLVASFGAALAAQRRNGQLTEDDFVQIRRFRDNPLMP